MKTPVRAAIAATFFAGLCAPVSVAFADTPVSTPTIVLVPRIIRGANAGVVRLKSTSPEARRFFAAQARLQAPAKAKLHSGTICLRTADCHSTKGSLGAGCISRK